MANYNRRYKNDELLAALKRNDGNISAAARELGISLTMYYHRKITDNTFDEAAKKIMKSKIINKKQAGDSTIAIRVDKRVKQRVINEARAQNITMREYVTRALIKEYWGEHEQ